MDWLLALPNLKLDSASESLLSALRVAAECNATASLAKLLNHLHGVGESLRQSAIKQAMCGTLGKPDALNALRLLMRVATDAAKAETLDEAFRQCNLKAAVLLLTHGANQRRATDDQLFKGLMLSPSGLKLRLSAHKLLSDGTVSDSALGEILHSIGGNELVFAAHPNIEQSTAANEEKQQKIPGGKLESKANSESLPKLAFSKPVLPELDSKLYPERKLVPGKVEPELAITRALAFRTWVTTNTQAKIPCEQMHILLNGIEPILLAHQIGGLLLELASAELSNRTTRVEDFKYILDHYVPSPDAIASQLRHIIMQLDIPDKSKPVLPGHASAARIMHAILMLPTVPRLPAPEQVFALLDAWHVLQLPAKMRDELFDRYTFHEQRLRTEFARSQFARDPNSGKSLQFTCMIGNQ